jgi:hypothetical protein
MARIKLKQILSNLHYNEADDQLILSGSKVPTALQNPEDLDVNWEEGFGNWDGTKTGTPDFIIYGNTVVTSSAYQSGTIDVSGSVAIVGNLFVSGSISSGSL